MTDTIERLAVAILAGRDDVELYLVLADELPGYATGTAARSACVAIPVATLSA